jgi:hypothetical protein
MQLRRPIAALFTALALFGGGTATLAGCGGDPAGLDRNDGTPDDNTKNTEGADPSGASQGNLPDNSDPDHGNPEDQNDDTQDPE